MTQPPARKRCPPALPACVRMPSRGQRRLRQMDSARSRSGARLSGPALRFGAVSAAAVARRMTLRSGEVATEISGSESGQLAIGIPGLSANLRSFDVVFAALDGAQHRKVAFEPRGRGRRSYSGPGSYVWHSPAPDVTEIANPV